MTELTVKQQAILAFIKSFTFITPTVREIAKHFKIHNSTAQGHLEALRRKGFL